MRGVAPRERRIVLSGVASLVALVVAGCAFFRA
jgi:hypothetical protein